MMAGVQTLSICLSISLCFASTKVFGQAAPGGVWIIQPVATNTHASAAMSVLGELFPDATTIQFANVSHDFTSCLHDRGVLVVPDVANFPTESWEPLTRYLNSGGRAVLLGCDPFESRVRLVDHRPQTEAELFHELVGEARAIDGVSSISQWRHESDSATQRGDVKPAEAPWPAVQATVGKFNDWDALVTSEISTGVIPDAVNSLVLYARGDAETSRLAVICAERDGSHWFNVVSLSGDWQSHVLHESNFNYFYGGWNRGRPGDHLSLSKLKKISIGLSMYLGAQDPSEHTFGVSDVRFVTDPRPVEQVVSWPDIMLVSPPYRHYDLTAGKARSQSPLPRARGTGGAVAAPYRWLPVGPAVSLRKVVLGWPTSIYLEPTASGELKNWAWIGMDVMQETRPLVKRALSDCVRILEQGRFLYRAGCEKFSCESGEPIKVTANSTVDPRLRIRAKLISEKGKVVRQVVSPTGNSAELDLGVAPEVEDDPRDFTLRVTLEEAAGKHKVYDQIDQPIKVFQSARTATEDEWVTVDGAYFNYQGKPIVLSGINYWPLSHNGRSPGEFAPHWLEPSVFDPEIIRRDLDRLQEVGINAVSIQYHEESQAPQLKFFVDECRRRGIWVHAFVGHLQPLEQNLAKAENVIEAADLGNLPGVFAIDIAWEPHLGNYGQRCGFDVHWEAWLNEQYGSIEHAEKVIGRPFLIKDDHVTGPSDDELRNDGSHRAFVAVYRRFVDDYISRRYGEVERLVRRVGCKQLLSARSGYGGTGNHWADALFPMDLGTGVVHFDFVSPEGYALTGDLDQFYEGGFLTAYARGVSGGKPVAWLEFGCSVGKNPQRIDLENQARLYRNMFELGLKSHTAGLFGWWYPSGWRVDERSDMGVVNPDSTWRPVGDEYRAAVRRVAKEPLKPLRWTGREIDRDSDARGVSGLWDTVREAYRKAMSENRIEELRPLGYGKLISELPVVSVGGVPYEAPAPLAFANAEWGKVEINGTEYPRRPGEKLKIKSGDRLRLELINTGPATWTNVVLVSVSDAGVVASVSDAGKRDVAGTATTTTAIEDPELTFGHRTWLWWTAPEAGNWQLRPLLRDVGQFGEPLEIEIVENKE